MKIAIMQPYFVPHLEYFRLISHVDKFVVYDDVQFTKKGWINRNLLWSPSGPWHVTIPVKNGPVHQLVRDKVISSEFSRNSVISRVRQNYKKFTIPGRLEFVENLIRFQEENLFSYILHSIREISEYLSINPEKIVVSSHIGDFRDLKSQEKVIEICESLGASSYLNPPGGKNLYSYDQFEEKGIKLNFLEPYTHKERDPLDVSNKYSTIHDILLFDMQQIRVRLS